MLVQAVIFCKNIMIYILLCFSKEVHLAGNWYEWLVLKKKQLKTKKTMFLTWKGSLLGIKVFKKMSNCWLRSSHLLRSILTLNNTLFLTPMSAANYNHILWALVNVTWWHNSTHSSSFIVINNEQDHLYIFIGSFKFVLTPPLPFLNHHPHTPQPLKQLGSL